MSSSHSRALFLLLVSFMAAVLSAPARATSIDLTTGTTGLVSLNDPFNGQTRAVDVTLVSAANRQVTSMTVTGVDIRGNASASVGARIYAGGGALLASAAVTAPVGEDQTITVPIAATLVSGSSYRLAFFVPSSGIGNRGNQFDPNPAGPSGFGYVESSGLFTVNGGYQDVGDLYPASSTPKIPLISLEVADGTSYNLVGYYHRLETSSPGTLLSMAFKAGAAQGCPASGPTVQPCYSYDNDWTAVYFVAGTVGNGAPTWEWNGATLTATGLFWPTAFFGSNPNGYSMISDKVTNLAITPATHSTTAATYECVEGDFFQRLWLDVNGCQFTRPGPNYVNNTSVLWNAGGDSRCVNMTIGGDDYSMVEDTEGVPGTPSPRGLTARTAGQAGAGCVQTSGGFFSGTPGAFDLWNVIVDDGTRLILASAPDIGTCYLFGALATSACPVDPALAGISYLVLAAAGTTPDTDGDTVPDATDNCPSTANTDQADTDGDLRGNSCDNCPSTANTDQADFDGDLRGDVCDNCLSTANADQADTDGDLRGNACDNCRLLANNTGAGAQCDSDHDGFGNRCDGDLGSPAPGNGATNSQDTVLFRAQLGQPSVAPGYNKADLNCNGAVNAADTVLFRSLLGVPPGPGAGP